MGRRLTFRNILKGWESRHAKSILPQLTAFAGLLGGKRKLFLKDLVIPCLNYIAIETYRKQGYAWAVDMSTTNKRLGANMRRIREEKSLLQKDFAKKVGLDAAYLSNIENGKMNVTIATLEKIAKALGVQLKELM